MPQLQPVPTAVHELGNPWISYSVYLNNTFIPGMLQIMILLTTVFSIGTEIKHGTSREWLARSHNSVVLAITGKLLPQTVLFFIMMSIAPSLRIGLSIAALFGIISISITGFSFPVPAMYPPFQLLSNIFPLRHYFLIYADQALNGIPLYYSRMHYLYLFLFAIASLPLLKRLKTALQNQVYVP